MDEEDIQNSDSSAGEEQVDSQEADGQQTEEETKKARSAEGRISELTGKIKELEERLEEKKTPMPPTDSKVNPEVQRAVEQLKNLGFMTKDEFEDRLKVSEDRQTLNSEHSRLENTYDGSDGRPKYDKKAIEDYMREKGVYDAQIAYDYMHRDELLDWELKRAEETKKQKPYVEKQGQPQVNRDDDTITREKIADWMKTPEGRIKYERNRAKILTLMQQGQL